MARNYLLTNKDTIETRRKSLEVFSKGLYSKLFENETYPYNWISGERESFVDTHSDTYTTPNGTGKYYDLLGYTKGIGIRKEKQYQNVEFGSDEDVQHTYDSSLWSYHKMEVSNGQYDNYYDYALNAYNYQKTQGLYRAILNRRDYYGLFDPNRVETYFTYDEDDDGVGVFRDWNIYENLPVIESINDTINPNSEVNDTALGQISNVINKYMMAGTFDYYRRRGEKEPGITKGIDHKLGMRPENMDENGSSYGFVQSWRWENNAVSARNGKTTAEILGLSADAIVSTDLARTLESIKKYEPKEIPEGQNGINTWKYFLKSVSYNKNKKLDGDFIKENEGYTPKADERYAKYEWLTPGERLGGKNSGITIVPTKDIEFPGESNKTTKVSQTVPDDKGDVMDPGSDILSKTKALFSLNKIPTLVGRSSALEDEDRINDIDPTTDTVLFKSKASPKANPRGRAIYDGTFYRTWTKEKRYGPQDTRIRHGEMDKYQEALKRFRFTVDSKGKLGASPAYLLDNTVLKKNGYVRIVPTMEDHALGRDTNYKTMLSIENLAWKDCEKSNFTDGELGPHGGRIMWFIPYNLTFNETIAVTWNNDKFIGRGEKIFTYAKTRRDANLGFKLLVDYPSTINNYSAMGIDNDPKGKQIDSLHYDILRYFAGCETKKRVTPPPAPPTIPPTDNIEPEENPGNGNKITISVYFPNNYTGHYYSAAFQTSEVEKKRPFTSYDPDFFKYLMGGYNTEVTYAATEYQPEIRGYLTATESIRENGISSSDETYGKSILVNKDGQTDKCYYRVDYDYQNQNQHDRNIKFRTMELRPSNYMDFAEQGEYGKQTLNLNMHNNRYTLFDLKYALEEIKAESGQTEIDERVLDLSPGVYGKKISGFTDQNNVELLKRLLRGELKINKVRYLGVATKQDAKNASSLAWRRGNTLKGFLLNLFKQSKDFEGEVAIKSENPSKIKSVNTLSAKELRRGDIEIEYDPSEIVGEDTIWEETITTTLQANESNEDSVVPDYIGLEWMNFHELTPETRLEDESVFDKQRHFGPAYHSTTPEGFNARLNFLHQCTRQGHTSTASDKVNTGSAGNLGFGRMPVCILRLGDFIYSKVIINSLNINFGRGGGMLWDMNPEGIGVQPMYADVNMNITFIGGQSLKGPLPRIQNGVSFNYYANTPAYDPRAQQFTGDTVYNGEKVRKVGETIQKEDAYVDEETTSTTAAPTVESTETPNEDNGGSILEMPNESYKYEPYNWDTNPEMPFWGDMT